MKKNLVLLVMLALTLVSCSSRTPTLPSQTTEEVTDSEIGNNIHIRQSVADLVKIPTEPVEHPPIRPGQYGAEYSVGLDYTLSSDNSYYSVSGIGACTDSLLVIPAEYLGKPVKEIQSNAFFKNDTIISVYISDGIDSIHESAFSMCSNLSNIRFPTGLEYLGRECFSDCTNLLEVSIPEGVNEIPIYAFYNCINLQKVMLPSTIKVIKQSAFSQCESLYEISLPEGLEIIEKSVFVGASSLKNIAVPSTIKVVTASSFRSESECIYDMDWPEGGHKGQIKPSGWIHNMYYQGTLEQYLNLAENMGAEMPMFGYAVNFYIDNDLVDFLVIPPKTYIPSGAFMYCQSLIGVILPEDLILKYTDDGNFDTVRAFNYCPNLEFIVVKGDLPKNTLNKGHLRNWLYDNFAQITATDKGDHKISTLSAINVFLSVSDSEEAKCFVEMTNNELVRVNVNLYYSEDWKYNVDGLPMPKHE